MDIDEISSVMEQESGSHKNKGQKITVERIGNRMNGERASELFDDTKLNSIVHLQSPSDFVGFEGHQDPAEASQAFFEAGAEMQYEYLSQWFMGNRADDVHEGIQLSRDYSVYLVQDTRNAFLMILNSNMGTAALEHVLAEHEDTQISIDDAFQAIEDMDEQEPAQEDLTEAEEETVNVINDLASINYDSEDEQHQMVQLLLGVASQQEGNEVADVAMDKLDEILEEWRDRVQDEFEVDFDSVGE